MSNLFPTTTTASTVTKIEATEIARRLYADDANAFAAVSTTAAREAFCKRCASLAISAMVHGDDSRLRRLKAKAIELPEYKKTKSGEITGNLGKLLLAYSEAASIGFMLRDVMKQNGTDVTKVDLWDLSIIESSPSFGALTAPPKARIKETATTTDDHDDDHARRPRLSPRHTGQNSPARLAMPTMPCLRWLLMLRRMLSMRRRLLLLLSFCAMQ
jgi:hypothetical protein